VRTVTVSVTADVEAFIVDEITVGRGIRSIGPDDDLLAGGIIDSLGVTQLVAFLEERFGIRVSDDELVPSNFRTLTAIEAFVGCKQPC
jgi:acyl carrier protein